MFIQIGLKSEKKRQFRETKRTEKTQKLIAFGLVFGSRPKVEFNPFFYTIFPFLAHISLQNLASKHVEAVETRCAKNEIYY